MPSSFKNNMMSYANNSNATKGQAKLQLFLLLTKRIFFSSFYSCALVLQTQSIYSKFDNGVMFTLVAGQLIRQNRRLFSQHMNIVNRIQVQYIGTKQ